MNYKTLAFGAFAAVALSAIGSMAAAKTRIIVNCFWPPQHFVCQKVLPGWLEAVEEVTEGRVVGNIPPKSVAPPPEQLASVEKGIVDANISRHATRPRSGSFPRLVSSEVQRAASFTPHSAIGPRGERLAHPGGLCYWRASRELAH